MIRKLKNEEKQNRYINVASFSTQFVDLLALSSYNNGKKVGTEQGTNEGFIQGYLTCYSDFMKNKYMQEGMNMSESSVILGEIKDFRTDFNEKFKEVDGRLRTVETDIAIIKSNTTRDSKKKEIRRTIWTTILTILGSGIAASVGAAIVSHFHLF